MERSSDQVFQRDFRIKSKFLLLDILTHIHKDKATHLFWASCQSFRGILTRDCKMIKDYFLKHQTGKIEKK